MFHDFRCIREIARKIPHCYFRVTAIADKLGVEFALIHRTATSGAEEHVHVLVGDGMTAVILRAEAVLHAETRMRSSIRLSFASPEPLWMMKTSSSRTDSPIFTLVSPLENLRTMQGVRGMLSLYKEKCIFFRGMIYGKGVE